MLTKIKLKTMATTNIETILNDVSSDIAQTILVSTSLLEQLLTLYPADEVLDALHNLNWGAKPVSDKVYNQYFKINHFGLDYEIILRYTAHGSKTSIFIKTDPVENGYDNADVTIIYNGSDIRYYEEMYVFGIAKNNIESFKGDDPLLDIKMRLEYEFAKDDISEPTPKSLFVKLPPDEYKLSCIKSGRSVTVVKESNDIKNITAQNGESIDIDID